jgi:pimeloyl-ACP methyl ester carboxylesterase
MLTQARYLGCDLRPLHLEKSGPQIVLLHGLYASAGVFRPLRDFLSKRFELGVHSFSYLPGPGIEELAARLERLVEGIHSRAPIVFVGHSLGGLVQRYYLSRDGCDARVAHSVSLASPFRGSRQSTLVPGQAGRDIAPQSPLLPLIRGGGPHCQRTPHLTLVAEEDELILPDAFPEYGKSAIIPQTGHNGILFNEAMMEKVASVVRAFC